MKKYTKIYLDYFGYCKEDIILCEWCEKRIAVDINHIEARGMGGSKTKDHIENLMAMCRECHNDFEAKKITIEQARAKHLKILNILQGED